MFTPEEVWLAIESAHAVDVHTERLVWISLPFIRDTRSMIRRGWRIGTLLLDPRTVAEPSVFESVFSLLDGMDRDSVCDVVAEAARRIVQPLVN